VGAFERWNVKRWKDGRMEEWKIGRMEDWKIGGKVAEGPKGAEEPRRMGAWELGCAGAREPG
jgi:hypothetical protein